MTDPFRKVELPPDIHPLPDSVTPYVNFGYASSASY